MADPITSLHYTPGANIVHGAYAPAAAGFNLADISSASSLSALPAGVQALVYVGLGNGVDSAFLAAVTPFLGKSNVFGFYLYDEPNPSTVSAANLKAESDYIHAHFPGAKTFIVLQNFGTPQNPNYQNTYNPANTGIDLYGLDPYPVRPQFAGGMDLSVIPAAVSAAEAAGIPLSQIVPVYQAFGGGGYNSWTVPTAAQEQQILATWGSVVPNPPFDYAYAWGVQSGDTALSTDPSLQTVFQSHNTSLVVACFAEGTRIATMRGPRPVEAIEPGEHVLTASGRLARVRWTGHRRIACARHPRPDLVHPVLVAPGAIAPGVPARALRLSPDHAVLREGVLIPVRLLANGDTIRTEPVATVTYWHIELDRHDVLFAEGLACESYLDTGNRGAFVEAEAGPVDLYPDFAPRSWNRDACAELVTDPRDPRKVAAKASAMARAAPPTQEADIALDLGNTLLRPRREGAWLVFDLPRGAARGWLVSSTYRPCERLADSGDTRSLGIAVQALRLDGVPLALSSLRNGWHAAEADWRWTNGRAAIKLRGASRLSLRLGPQGLYLAPDAASHRAGAAPAGLRAAR